MPVLRVLSILLAALLPILFPAGPAAAQQAGGPAAVPAKRLLGLADTDFPGHDIRSLFGVDADACFAACTGTDACQALTFNARSNACFLKSAPADPQPYVGAISARAIPTDPAALDVAPTRARELKFLSGDDLTAARTLSMQLSRQVDPTTLDSPVARQASEARAAARTDPQRAHALMAAALARTDDAPAWRDFADLSLRLSGGDDRGKSPERRDRDRALRQTALQAAAGAYLRSRDAQMQVSSLMVMARALEANDRGRDMISALKLAQSLNGGANGVDAALAAARAKYGFRITDSTVESDLASPRICAIFAAPVKSGGEAYADFVTMPDATPVVSAEGRQVCVEGLEHGQPLCHHLPPGDDRRLGRAAGEDGDHHPLRRRPQSAGLVPGPRLHPAADRPGGAADPLGQRHDRRPGVVPRVRPQPDPRRSRPTTSRSR